MASSKITFKFSHTELEIISDLIQLESDRLFVIYEDQYLDPDPDVRFMDYSDLVDRLKIINDLSHRIIFELNKLES